MHDFTPWTAAAGGALIGLAACLLLGLNGRIAGVSGALRGLVAPGPDQRSASERLWRALFLLGLVLGAGIYALLQPAVAVPRQGFPLWALLLGGLLIGFGTSRANGCTSGHGVCGLGRLSLRSLAAVCTFLSVALLTTYVCRHLLGVGT